MWITIYILLSILSSFQENGVNSVAFPPVKFVIFYESLCPDSVDFLVKILQPMYRDLKSVMNLQIYAYGKVMESYDARNKTYKFQCHHGPEECNVNKVLECAKKYIKDRETYLKFLFCVMASKNQSGSRSCSRSYRISYLPIRRCSISKEGNRLHHLAGVIQQKMAPNLWEIPWVMVNGKFTRFVGMNQGVGQTHFLQQICKNYKGKTPRIHWFS